MGRDYTVPYVMAFGFHDDHSAYHDTYFFTENIFHAMLQSAICLKNTQ